MEDTHSQDKRRFHRYTHKEAVEIRFKDPARFCGCLSVDLGGGGVRVYLNDFIPINTEVALEIMLTDEQIVNCTGRVIWVRKERFNDHYQVGLEFTGDETGRLIQNRIGRYFLSQYT